MNDVKRHRRWRNNAAWFLAFWVWIIPGSIVLLNILLDDVVFTWRFWLMIVLSAAYSGLIIAGWKPWKKED